MKVNFEHTFKVGDILTVANGEYSDFTYIGPFKVIKEFSTKEVSEVYANLPDSEEEYDAYTYSYANDYVGLWRKAEKTYVGKKMRTIENNLPENFHAWLVKEGYVEAMDSIEWHVGCYGKFAP